ncbi:MAG: hypothetical protein OIF51_02310 [Cellvibrionaceae bacterium]|nr:hypothetical protein [Cellvibrionaceae bacterium]
MNFFVSALSTILLGLVVGFALSLQKAEPPTEFEKYSSANMDFATMSEVGYAMAAFGRESTADYFELKDYQEYVQLAQNDHAKALNASDAPQVAASEAQASKAEAPTMQLAQVERPAKPKAKPSLKDWPKSVIGIQRSTELINVEKVWQEFASNSALSDQLDSYTVSVFAIYSDFNSDYSRATISIGYDKPSMKGEQQLIPKGKIETLLKPSNYGNNALLNAWQDIDYSKAVKAVVERRDYTQNSELTSLFVIYQ